MDKERVLAIAKEIYKQLFWSVTQSEVWSWGLSKTVATIRNNMATLGLRVSGAVFKGWVYVSLNEAADTYTINLVTVRGVTKQTLTDIYCDNVGITIDRLVERDPKWTTEQYKRKQQADTRKKLMSHI